MKNMIEIKNLVKLYGDQKVLDNISLNIKEGEIFGLLGPNGAGKTTLIRTLTTISNPTCGSCFINGLDVQKNPLETRMNFGLVSQELTIDDKLTAWDNLYLSCRYYHIDKNSMKNRIHSALEVVNLLDSKMKIVDQFSGGMKKRLDIAIALVNHPKIVFMDEPTLGLDIQTRKNIWDYIEYLRSKFKTTIFLTTHYMEEADLLCDRIAIIDHGVIKALDKPEKLKKIISGDIITIESSGNETEIINVLKDKDYIINIKNQSDKVIAHVYNSSQVIPDIFKSIEDAKLEVDSLSVKKTTLDDVFLEITGNALISKNNQNNHRGRN